MFSVIVPIYNSEKYLEECIESILCQNYTDFELLLINDGSCDKSREICDRYASKDKRIRCFHRQNSGVGNTRNFGIEQATGEWICFIDSDDEVCKNYLSAFDIELTEADIVITGIDFINIQTNDLIRREQYRPMVIDLEKDSKSLIPFLSIGFPVAKAYRKELLIKNVLRFPTDISFHEDHVFVLDCFLHSRTIEVKNDVTYIYRIDYSNQSLSKKKHPWQNHWAASNYMFDRLFIIKDVFGFNEFSMQNIYTFAYEPVISAIYDLYDSHCDKRKRKEILQILLKGNLPIKKYFFPKSGRGKFIKCLSQILPNGLLDMFFVIVNKYQKRRK